MVLDLFVFFFTDSFIGLKGKVTERGGEMEREKFLTFWGSHFLKNLMKAIQPLSRKINTHAQSVLSGGPESLLPILGLPGVHGP